MTGTLMNKNFPVSQKTSGYEVLEIIRGEYKYIGNPQKTQFDNLSNSKNSNSSSLVFFKGDIVATLNYINSSLASIIVLEYSTYEGVLNEADVDKLDSKLLIFTNSPRTNFSIISESFLRKNISSSSHNLIDKTVIISREARIQKNVKIGPYTIIGEVEIGCNVKIGANVIIKEGVNIGDNVTIGDNCIIGAEAYAEILDEVHSTGTNFPQLGGVILNRGVRIGSNCIIQRGALQDTIIGENTAIDNNVVIAHNVEIGKKVTIIGSTHIAGSVSIGDNVFIGQSVTVANVGRIGANAYIGIGSVVINAVRDGQRVFGNPAKQLHVPSVKR
jgi:UDP-3-O-[3-hydroxymyristoyl] glucosamine N-acyltransferase LpxD